MVIARFKPSYMPAASSISLSGPTLSLGRTDVDAVLQRRGCYRIEKFLATFDAELTEAGKYLERSFILYYNDGTDPALVAGELSQLPCFEDAHVNKRLQKVYCGTSRFVRVAFNAGVSGYADANSGIDSTLYVPGEVLITFTAQCAPDPLEISTHAPATFGNLQIDTMMAALGIEAISKVVRPTENPIGEASRRIDCMYVLMFDTTLAVASVIESLSALACIERISPNWIIPVELLGTRRYEPQGTQFSQQWYLDTLVVGDYLDIDAPEAWAIEWGDTNVIIGILDTGTMFACHYGHQTTHNPMTPLAAVVQSSASVSLQFTEEYVTATDRRLYVDLDLKDIADVRTCVLSFRPGLEHLELLSWAQGDLSLGGVLFTPTVRNGVPELFFVVMVSESFASTSARLGRLSFDVQTNESLVLDEDAFLLAVGDLLQYGEGGTAVAASINPVVGRTLDNEVVRVYHNRLEQCFPNPFNPMTTIAFSIKEAGAVSLTIYDVAGRQVRRLLSERQEPGAYQIVWDGRNDNGAPVSSGVYFHKLVAKSFVSTKKMTLLK